ncbi:MAG TPA: competence/damage-inducible protein A, partial [Stellaceae bacterium]|nr:competence/damage-inducible protein A [Stellaceae bacterium]
VPSVAQAMFGALRDRLEGGEVVHSRSVSCRLAEGQIAAPLGEIQASFPNVEIGSYPAWTDQRPQVAIVLRGTDESTLARATEEVAAMVRSLGGDPVES